MLQNLYLNDMPTFQHVSDACIALKVTCRIDMNALYNELSLSKDALQHTVKCEKKLSARNGSSIFACAKNVPNVFHLVSLINGLTTLMST